jgi:L-lactate dehydrogenase (cytochrome)
MAGGERGVQRVVDLLTGEIVRTLQLLGADSVTRLEPAHVRLRP